MGLAATKENALHVGDVLCDPLGDDDCSLKEALLVGEVRNVVW